MNSTSSWVNTSHEQHTNDNQDDDLAELLWMCISPIILFTGIVGNTVSAVIMCRPRMRRHRTSICLFVLAVTDVLVLLIGLLRYWLMFQFDFDLRATSSFMCPFHTFLTYWITTFCSWVTIAVSFERFASLFFASFHLRTTKKFLHYVGAYISILAILIGLLNAPLLFAVNTGELEYIVNDEVQIIAICDIKPEWDVFMLLIWPWIDFTFCFLIPYLILIVLNSGLVWNIIQTHRQPSWVNHYRVWNSWPLVLVCCSFLVFELPFGIYFLVQDHIDNHAPTKRFLIWTCANILSYLDSTINFFLYFLSSQKFRNEIRSILVRNQVMPDELCVPGSQHIALQPRKSC